MNLAPIRHYGATLGRVLLFLLLLSAYVAAPAGELNAQTPGMLDLGFNPGSGYVNGGIEAVVPLSGGKVLIGGSFVTVAGTLRYGVARLHSDGSVDEGFNPRGGANGPVLALAAQSDGKVLVGGDFTRFDATARNRIARLNADGSLDTSFNPGSGVDGFFSAVSSIAVQRDGRVLIGGDFISFNGIPRSRIARLNADGSLDTSFDPGSGANGYISSLAVQGDGKVLIGGSFTSFNGTPRNRIARLNADGTLDTGFDPGTGAGNTIHTLAVQSDGKVLIGGQFTSFNGTARNRIARLNADGALDTSFDPGTGVAHSVGPGVVNSLAVQSDGEVLVGGDFTSFNGTPRNRLVRLNADGTLDTGHDPGAGADGAIQSLAVQSDGKVLIAGEFTSFNGTARYRIARLNADGATDIDFLPNTGASSTVYTLAELSDGKVLIGGSFTSFSERIRNRIARLNADGTLDVSFNPGAGADAAVLAVAELSNGKMLIGGSFTSFNGTPRSRIARLNSDGSLDTSFDPGAGGDRFAGSVSSLAVQSDGKVLVGGSFTSFNGTPRNCIARLNADGSLDTSFDPGTGVDNSAGSVSSIAVQSDGKVIIGGAFTSFNGTPLNRIARLNADGSLDTSFDPGTGANLYIFSLGVQSDGKVLIGGDFSSFNGTARNCIARLNAGGSLDTSFDPGLGANRYVSSLAVQSDGKVLIGGDFSSFNGTARNRIARLNADGSLDTSFDPGAGANNALSSLTVQSDGKVLIGGEFTSFNGTARAFLARLHNDPARQTLTVPATDQVQWLRGGASPEVQEVTFELSINGGSEWIVLGMGTRISGGWELTGINLPASGQIRVRARTSGLSSLVETVEDFSISLTHPLKSTVAAKGGAVPEAGVDPRIPAGSIWSSFGVPSINDSGAVAFLANVKGSSSFSGIFAGELSAPALVARKGEGAPGAGEAMFSSFREPLFSNAGEVAFIATLSGSGVLATNRQGLWKATPNEEGHGFAVQLLARAGDEPAGVPGAQWKSFISVLLHGEAADPSTHSVVALATMVRGSGGMAGPGGVTSSNDLGLWRFDANGAHLLLREGQALEVRGVVTTVRSFVALSSVSGSPGHGRVFAAHGALIRVRLTDGRYALCQAEGGSLAVLAVTGDEIEPGVFLSSLAAPAGDAAGATLAKVLLKGAGVTSVNRTAIALFSKAGPEGLLYRTGVDLLPAGSPLVRTFRDPVTNLGGEAFLATLSGDSVVSTSNTAIVWHDDSGSRVVAREGAEPAGVPAAQWASFTSLALPEERGPLFTAKLRIGSAGAAGPGGVTTIDDVGLWGVDSTGALHLIAREGATHEGKTLRKFTILSAVSGSLAQRRFYNAQGALIYRAYFTDGSQALIKVQMP